MNSLTMPSDDDQPIPSDEVPIIPDAEAPVIPEADVSSVDPLSNVTLIVGLGLVLTATSYGALGAT